MKRRVPRLRQLLRRLGLWWRCSLRKPFQPVLGGRAMASAEIGRFGERLAAKWLKRHGRKVLYRNFRGPKGGEVDISCRHGKVLAFVEVKTRTSEAFGRPADAVDREKQALIQRGATEWLRLLGRPVLTFRFDIVEVILTEGRRPEVRVIENAFQMPPSDMTGRTKGKKSRKG